jgi:lysophospholipase L1-like esterase
MRIRFFSLTMLVMLCGSTLAHAAAQPTYYLALGDSLAVGLQPSASGDVPTNQGYTDDIFDVYHLIKPGLTLVKLGCSGETTYTMIYGGICNYGAEGSQLDAAVSFLETHKVALVTLDIGANDVDGCVTLSPLNLDIGCVETGSMNVSTNLPMILRALRSAAGEGTPIVGMNYYDPFLAAWELGPAGQTLAAQSLAAATGFNTALEGIYQLFAIPVADVAKAFRISNSTPIPDLNIPVNVFLTLTWTWMAAPAPYGPDIHPNAAGYAVIAGAFAKILIP